MVPLGCYRYRYGRCSSGSRSGTRHRAIGRHIRCHLLLLLHQRRRRTGRRNGGGGGARKEYVKIARRARGQVVWQPPFSLQQPGGMWWTDVRRQCAATASRAA